MEKFRIPFIHKKKYREEIPPMTDKERRELLLSCNEWVNREQFDSEDFAGFVHDLARLAGGKPSHDGDIHVTMSTHLSRTPGEIDLHYIADHGGASSSITLGTYASWVLSHYLPVHNGSKSLADNLSFMRQPKLISTVKRNSVAKDRIAACEMGNAYITRTMKPEEMQKACRQIMKLYQS